MKKLAFYSDNKDVCYYLYFDQNYSLLERYSLEEVETVPNDGVPISWIKEAYELPENLVTLNQFVDQVKKQFSDEKISSFYTREWPEDVHTTWRKSLGPVDNHSKSLDPQRLTRRNTRLEP